MRSLALLALIALAALPLSAHESWREPHRRGVEAPRYAPSPRWEARHRHDRWDDRWERRGYDCGWDRRYDRPYGCEDRDDRVLLRPLPRPLDPPFGARVELRFR